VVQYHLRLLYGLTAFWTVEVWGIRDAFNFMTLLLAGSIVPLWFFPDWLQRVVTALPFAAIAHAPLSIFIGRLSGVDAWRTIGLQAVWSGVLILAAYGLWRLAERKVIVQGG
jgi:ABC-2 type transport system permease protein